MALTSRIDADHWQIHAGPFVFARGPRTWWMRLFGVGVRYADHRRRLPTFVERYGYARVLHIGPHCFRWLPRPKEQRVVGIKAWDRGER